MTNKRNVEIFSAGCSLCSDAIALVEKIACDSCDITILKMSDEEVKKKARELGIRSVPAIAVDGRLLECCSDKGVDEEVLKSAGVGAKLSCCSHLY